MRRDEAVLPDKLTRAASALGVRVERTRLVVIVAAVGLVVGGIGAWLLTRLMRNLLFGVTASDPVSFVAGGGLLVVTMLVATLIPAGRAMRASPLDSMIPLAKPSAYVMLAVCWRLETCLSRGASP